VHYRGDSAEFAAILLSDLVLGPDVLFVFNSLFSFRFFAN
jgi:hypothetical protein